jgi:hypothetical protein
VVRDIYVRNLSVEAATHALSLRGHPESPIQRLRVTDSTFKSVTKPNVLKYVEDIRLRNVFIAEGV